MNILGRIGRGVARAGLRMMAAGDSQSQLESAWAAGDDPPAMSSGRAVTPTTALRLSTVYACVRLWSWSIGMLPMSLYESLGPGRKRKAVEHPIYALLHDEPNEYQTPFEFQQETVAALAIRGQGLSEKILGRSGETEQLWPIQNDFWYADWHNRKSGRRRVYDIASSWDGRARTLRDDQVWHPRLMSLDGGLNGASPIRLCSEGIGIALAIQHAGASVYRTGLRPAFYLSTEQKLSDPEADAIAERVRKRHGGIDKWGKPLVLSSGSKAMPLQITPEDAQLLEAMKMSVAECVRMFGIPLTLVQAESTDTGYASVVSAIKDGFHTFTILPLGVNLEQSADRALVMERRRFFSKYSMDALLRADLLARYQSYRIGLGPNNPFLTRNHVLGWEDLDRDDGPEGDEYMVARNNTGPMPNDMAAEALASVVEDVHAGVNGKNGERRAA